MRHKAREEIQREVTVLTAEQIRERYVAEGGLESRERQPGPLSPEDRLAAVRWNEPRRIWTLMGGTAWDAYSSERDAQADRWHQALRHRQEGASDGAVESDSGLIRYRIVAQRTDPALAHHGLNLVKESARTGDQLTDIGRPSVPGAKSWEESEAPAELVERVLVVCGQHYAAVTGTSSDQWDQESSRELVDIALQPMRRADRETYPQVLEAFLHEHRARLERLWRRYGPEGMFAGEVVLIDLPGCFVLCERIDSSPLWLEGVWTRESQEENALERLKNAWRYDTGEEDGR